MRPDIRQAAARPLVSVVGPTIRQSRPELSRTASMFARSR
jgi:hypothetical protein